MRWRVLAQCWPRPSRPSTPTARSPAACGAPAVVLPLLKAGLAAILSLAIGGALLGAHFGLMVPQLTWIQLMGSVVLLAVGYAALITKRFLVTERGKEKSDAESAESSSMLGIAYQAQEQLDLAQDKFRHARMRGGGHQQGAGEGSGPALPERGMDGQGHPAVPGYMTAKPTAAAAVS